MIPEFVAKWVSGHGMPSSYLCVTPGEVDVSVNKETSSTHSQRASLLSCRSLSVTSSPISSELVFYHIANATSHFICSLACLLASCMFTACHRAANILLIPFLSCAFLPAGLPVGQLCRYCFYSGGRFFVFFVAPIRVKFTARFHVEWLRGVDLWAKNFENLDFLNKMYR